MAATTSPGDLSSGAPVMAVDQHDPFISGDNSPMERESRHRYSNFDSRLFALGSNASPAQAKRALEAHLAETDRRMEEAGKLGTALVQQRKELTQQLEEVEKLQAEGEVSEELKEKLAEIEKDYNDVARESARAFLPKPRIPSNEAATGSPFVLEGRGGRVSRSVSPSKFEAQATNSPTKLSVPNRKLRNQPTNRVHDIEFAAEISQSLIIQVRNLQAILSEKEEELRDVKIEKSKLEYDTESFQQRVKALDESQSRYKDENWSLETQVHELLASQRESSDREKKLQQTVSILQAEKNTAQRDLDEVRLSHAKLSEEHAAAVKHHDTELGAAKRNIVMADSERSALMRKVDDLTGQNQELAKAVSSQRGRALDRPEILGTSDEDFQTANDNDTPEHSPPPSPIKGTPRHSMLESETLKTSLAHAQRTIQSLRTNVHREKTEKLELRRMLQDARDDLEKVRADPMPATKRERAPKPTSRDFKKPPRLLGGPRTARSEVVVEDPDWEDQTVISSPGQSTIGRRNSSRFSPVLESVETDNFDTANETSDQAFETANERDAETDDFHTGAEEFSSDDAQTETDSPSKRNTLRGRPPHLPMGLSRSKSVSSTASTEDEYGFDDTRTPSSQVSALHSKYPLRVSRGAFRRSRQASEDPTLRSSPAGFANSAGGTPQPVQSLAAELGDFDGSDNDSNMSATPSRRSIHLSRPGSIRGMTGSPPPPVPQLRRATMVDNGTMTEPLRDLTSSLFASTTARERPMSMNTAVSGLSDYSDAGTLSMEENLAKFPSPPTSPPKRDFSMSEVLSHDMAPIEQPDLHAIELDLLRQEHVKQIEDIHNGKDTVHAAALAALEAKHTEAVNRAIADAQTAHGRALDSIRTGHDEDKNRALSEVHTAHARELESLQAGHLEKIAQNESEYQATHALKIESLQRSHAEQLDRSAAATEEAHAAELARLTAAHNAQIELAKTELTTKHDAALAALSATHASQVEEIRNNSDAAHADELKRLEATHLAQIENARNALVTTHKQELDTLKTTHSSEVEESKRTSESSHAAELAALAALHAKQLEASNIDNDARLNRELDGLRASHSQQLESSKSEADAHLAAQLNELRAAHVDELSASKSESGARLAAELAAIKLAHDEALKSSSADAESKLAQEIRALQSEHAQQVETMRLEEAAKAKGELESLRATHAAELKKVVAHKDAAHAAEVAALAATHAKQLDDLAAQRDSAHTEELATLADTHAKHLDDLATKKDAAHASELAALLDTHANQVEQLAAKRNAAHAAELEGLVDTHAKQLNDLEAQGKTAHAAELAALADAHAKQLEDHTTKRDAVHVAALAALAETHSQQLAVTKSDGEATLARELASLRDSHASDIDVLKNEHSAAHAKALESFEAALAKQLESSKSEDDAAHNQQIEAITAANAQIVEAHKRDSQKALEQALDSARNNHEREIQTLQADHAAARLKEVDSLSSNHADKLAALEAALLAAKAREIEDLRSTHDDKLAALEASLVSSKAKEIEDLKSSHADELASREITSAAAKTKELEDLKSNHAGELAALQQSLIAAKTQEIEALSSQHEQRVAALQNEHGTAKENELKELSATHKKQLEAMLAGAAAAKMQELADLASSHQREVELLRAESNTTREEEARNLTTKHQSDIEALQANAIAARDDEIRALRSQHAEHIDTINSQASAARAQDLDESKTAHANALASLQSQHQGTIAKLTADLAASHALELERLRSEHEASRTSAVAALEGKHSTDIEALQQEHNNSKAQDLEQLKSEHSTFLASVRAEHQSSLDSALETLKANHAKDIESLSDNHANNLESALATIKSGHATDLAELKATSDAALAQALEQANAEHASALDSQRSQSLAERDSLLASHALELEALRKALTIAPPMLGYSSMNTIETEPIAEPDILRSPRREAFILPRDADHLHTPESSALGIFGKKNRGTVTPVIAEDDTSQSPNASASPETPESQRPFKEISTNTDARPARKQVSAMEDHGSQTALTSEGLDQLLSKNRRRGSQSSTKMGVYPAEIVVTPSEEVAPPMMPQKEANENMPSDAGILSTPGQSLSRRPGSSSSNRDAKQAMPPLPANHREVIEAARTGSSHGAKGAMGPPLLPASAYKNTAGRPNTPRDRPLSPMSGRGTPTPRAVRAGSSQGYADVHSPTKLSARSRQSSVSSFASEIETRFNRNELGMGASSFAGPNTDPRMIQAITQTMIGEYLWKYTRKAGRGEMSENRHRRYFWVHPYTRTLYWSDRDPSAAGRSELKAKSIPIEAVRVVTDDNPMPPGLHRKSLVIISPGRTVKFTCTTGQRHETWFNALSYLLLRTGNEGQADAEDPAGHITQEDVDEFNPSYGASAANGNRRAPPSLSSYNSRTTRNESPHVDHGIPTLTPTRERQSVRPGTLGRLSGYLNRTSTSGSIFSTLRSKSHGPHPNEGAIYEASEVNDSAEELRQIIEQQDRDSDRLENVRACCDGKHDVGTLTRGSKRNRPGHSHSHSHSHPGQSATPTPLGTVKSRG